MHPAVHVQLADKLATVAGARLMVIHVPNFSFTRVEHSMPNPQHSKTMYVYLMKLG